MKRVFGFVGHSGSGKTTLLCKLIREYARRDIAVGVVKHTHHAIDPIPPENRGDTLQFIDSGAERVIVASDSGRARLWSDGETFEFGWNAPRELFSHLPDTILVEGFKSTGAWPKVIIGAPLVNVDAVAIVRDELVEHSPVARFGRDDVQALLAFLDTIAAP